jgi:hypothetical protein
MILLCAGCQTVTGPADEPNGDDGTFGGDARGKGGTEEQPRIVLERDKVAEFRGVEMPKLLARMDGNDRDQWVYVRRHVHPAPEPPAVIKDNKLVRRNYDWPPANWKDMSDRQKAWSSYELWPDHIRKLLHQERVTNADGKVIQEAWDSEHVRRRLARYGRMYRTVYDFQKPEQFASEVIESEHWRKFAESMLAYGDDVRDMPVANMITALSNPEERVAYQAQDILVQVGRDHGAPVIEVLCAALWTSHNQMYEVNNAQGELEIVVQHNANFPKFVIDCLSAIGPRCASQAIYELEHGPVAGSAWRFRKHFVELLGRLNDAAAVEALEKELDRVKIVELDAAELAKGNEVIDERGTDYAEFVYREYLLQSLGKIGAAEGLRAIIRIWKLDESHEMAAIDAIRRIARRNVGSIAEARELAGKLKVDLKGA